MKLEAFETVLDSGDEGDPVWLNLSHVVSARAGFIELPSEPGDEKDSIRGIDTGVITMVDGTYYQIPWYEFRNLSEEKDENCKMIPTDAIENETASVIEQSIAKVAGRVYLNHQAMVHFHRVNGLSLEDFKTIATSIQMLMEKCNAMLRKTDELADPLCAKD